MDGSHPAPGAGSSLPLSIARRGARDPGWSALAARGRALGLGLVMRGVQRGHAALLRAADPLDLLALGCGALGAGAVLTRRATDRCMLLVTTDSALQAALRGRRSMLALVGPAQGDRRDHPAMLSLDEVTALGATVDALDPGMWGECLGALRPDDPALHQAAVTMTHAASAAALAGPFGAPDAMAQALAGLLGTEEAVG